MTGARASKFLPPRKGRQSGRVVRGSLGQCPKCTRDLDEGKYHDCGEQLSLFAELNRRPQ